MTLWGGGRELTQPEVSQHLLVAVWEAAMFRDVTLCAEVLGLLPGTCLH